MCVLLCLNVATSFVTSETSYSRPGTIGRAGRVRWVALGGSLVRRVASQTRPCIAPRPTALESALVVMVLVLVWNWMLRRTVTVTGIGCHRMLVCICVVARKASGCVLCVGSDPGHADNVCIHPCHCIHVVGVPTTHNDRVHPGVCHPGKDSTRTIQSLARPSGSPSNNLHLRS
jgi:hypothetical protein